ncbi:MAG: hypothetical protein H5T50_07025 [Nitrososphaeria archaeon]|nr:hypothetical protein [Nitrososphaeria archaeon]
MGKRWFQHYKRLANLKGKLEMIACVRKHVEEMFSQKTYTAEETMMALNGVLNLCMRKEAEVNESIKNEIRKYNQSNSRDPELDKLFKEIFGEN